METWVHSEFDAVDFGDHRLNERFRRLAERLGEHPELSIPAACHGRAEVEAAYRLLDNEKVDEAQILAAHRAATLQRMAAHRLVILAQDTTVLDLSRPKERIGGPLADLQHWGLLDHVMAAFTMDKVPLGIVAANVWARRPEDFGKRHLSRSRPIEFKESYRWLLAYRQACECVLQLPDTALVVVSDSEADNYEGFAEAVAMPSCKRAHFVTRACYDRRLNKKGDDRLLNYLSQMPVLASSVIEVSRRLAKNAKEERPRRMPRERRQASVNIRAARVTIARPDSRGGVRGPKQLTLNAVLVREEHPPKGEVAVEWLLLTDLPISSLSSVEQVVSIYGIRWGIEIYFRVLKSGCRVEKLQLETSERLKRCLMLYMVIAWRLLTITMLGRASPKAPCSCVLEDDEWRVLFALHRRKPPPKRPPPLAAAVAALASLGGYMGRSCDPPPGPKALWIGLQRLKDITLGWQVAAAMSGQAPV